MANEYLLISNQICIPVNLLNQFMHLLPLNCMGGLTYIYVHVLFQQGRYGLAELDLMQAVSTLIFPTGIRGSRPRR